MPVKYQTITLEEEPSGIYSTPYSNELTVVYDDKIVLYNELGDKKEYTIELAVSYMEPMGDYAWIIDGEKNMYKLTYVSDTELEVSDVILRGITYIDAAPDAFGAVTSSGELYVYGDNEKYCLGIDDKAFIDEPQKIDYIAEVKDIELTDSRTIILTETGSVYWAGKIIHSQGTEFVKRFIQLESDNQVADIVQGDTTYLICNEGTILKCAGYYISDKNYDSLFNADDVLSDEYIDSDVKCFSGGNEYSVWLNGKGEIFYWGLDFMQEIKSKADEIIYIQTPRRLSELSGVDMIYPCEDVVCARKGLDIYIIKKQTK